MESLIAIVINIVIGTLSLAKNRILRTIIKTVMGREVNMIFNKPIQQKNCLLASYGNWTCVRCKKSR